MIGKWHLGTDSKSKVEIYFRRNHDRWQYISVDGKYGAMLDDGAARAQLVSHRNGDGTVVLAESQTTPSNLVNRFYGM